LIRGRCSQKENLVYPALDINTLNTKTRV
jgi:hypothetical protein